MEDIVTNLSTLTTIPKDTLNKLFDKINYCICDKVYCDYILKKENNISLDIGIGTLNIYLENDEVKYRFQPSQEMEEGIKSIIIDKKNPLQFTLEKNFVSKIINTYKDII